MLLSLCPNLITLDLSGISWITDRSVLALLEVLANTHNDHGGNAMDNDGIGHAPPTTYVFSPSSFLLSLTPRVSSSVPQSVQSVSHYPHYHPLYQNHPHLTAIKTAMNPIVKAGCALKV